MQLQNTTRSFLIILGSATLAAIVFNLGLDHYGVRFSISQSHAATISVAQSADLQ